MTTRLQLRLIEAMFAAPLIGLSRRWPGVFHAVEMEQIAEAWPSGTVTAVCGARRLRVLVDGAMVGAWPPAIAGLPDGWTRCPSCHELTGRPRPRSMFERTA